MPFQQKCCRLTTENAFHQQELLYVTDYVIIHVFAGGHEMASVNPYSISFSL